MSSQHGGWLPPKRAAQGTDAEAAMLFYILASHIRHCPFHRILSVRVNPCFVLEEATQGLKSQKMRLIGGHFGGQRPPFIHASSHPFVICSSIQSINICGAPVCAKPWKQHTYTPKPREKRKPQRRKPLLDISLQFFF